MYYSFFRPSKKYLLVQFCLYFYLSITLPKYAKMGLRAAKIAPYSSARSKQLLCCFFAYLAKIDPIDFLKPRRRGLSSNRRHLWFKQHTHTTSTYFYVFLMTVIFFEVLSVISSINASGFGMELRQTIFFSTKI